MKTQNFQFKIHSFLPKVKFCHQMLQAHQLPENGQPVMLKASCYARAWCWIETRFPTGAASEMAFFSIHEKLYHRLGIALDFLHKDI
jgi:hypothetical protein